MAGMPSRERIYDIVAVRRRALVQTIVTELF